MSTTTQPLGFGGIVPGDLSKIVDISFEKTITSLFYTFLYILTVLFFVPPIIVTFIEGSQILNEDKISGSLLIVSGILIFIASIGFLYYISSGLHYPAVYPSKSLEPTTIIFIITIIYVIGILITVSVIWYNWSTSQPCSISVNTEPINDTEEPLQYADRKSYDKERIINICSTLLFFEFIILIVGIFTSSYILNGKRDSIIRSVVQLFKQNKNNKCVSNKDCTFDFTSVYNKLGPSFHEYLKNVP